MTPDLVAAFSGAVAAYDQLGKCGGANVKAVWSMVGLRRGNCRFQPCFEGAEGVGRQTRSDVGDAVAMASSETQELSSLDVAGEPWVLTQSSPLTTSEFCRRAEDRGINLDPPTLRELHRLRFLSPIFEVHNRRVSAPVSVEEPPVGGFGTWREEFRQARANGRLSDPRLAPFRPRQRFDSRRIDERESWWNGFLYSEWQVLELLNIRSLLGRRRRLGPESARRVRFPDVSLFEELENGNFRRLVLRILALEARYLPKLDPAWVRLTNAEHDDWRLYAAGFDPAAVALRLGTDAHGAQATAEGLLTRARGIDPLGDWYRVVRHADPEKWTKLKGDARLAMDLRRAAEVLLLFAEDLTGTSIDIPSDGWWHPLRERLVSPKEHLDDALLELGVSPHTRVTLLVEGETEELLAHRTLARLGLGDYPDVMRVLPMRGVGQSKYMRRLAAHVVAPIITGRSGDSYETARPVCHVVILADPEGPFGSQPKADKEVELILREVRLVLNAQGARIVEEDLRRLVELHVWGTSFEFEHFTDAELAAALKRIHPDRGGLSQAELRIRLAALRARGLPIKKLWQQWSPSPSKVKLAEELWPAFERRLARAIGGHAPAPPLAQYVDQAYSTATAARRIHYVLKAADPIDLADET